MDEFEARYRRIQEGDLSAAVSFVHELCSTDQTERAKRVSLLLSLAVEGIDCAPLGPTDDVEILSLRVRKALITLDLEELDAALAQLADGNDQHALWLGFREALFGVNGLSAQVGGDLYQRARSDNDPVLAIDAITLQVVTLMVAGRYEDALLKARQAARMAQTEHLWLPHYFASIFLARLRRLTGTCHAAIRIADAALATMPKVWHGWFEWERLCASATPRAAKLGTSPIAAGAMTLAYWLDPATEWVQPSGLDEVCRSTPHCRDVQAANALFGNPVPAGSDLDAWTSGADGPIPAHMQGFASLGVQTDAPGAFVLVEPGKPARRLAHVSVAKTTRILGPSPKQPTRVGMLLSALALAGEAGLPRDALFEQTYGFRYDAEAHDAAFRVLRHHASRHVAGLAELSHEAHVHRMKVSAPFAVADPRTVRPFKDMMLQMLARQGGQSARSVASDLGVPLRTVQAALREMVVDGMCSSERSGNKVTYEVEDTTFAPLTMA